MAWISNRIQVVGSECNPAFASQARTSQNSLQSHSASDSSKTMETHPCTSERGKVREEGCRREGGPTHVHDLSDFRRYCRLRTLSCFAHRNNSECLNLGLV